MLRKLAIAFVLAAATVAGTAGVAHAAPTKPAKPTVAYAAHGKVAQEAFWALSYNHPGVIICVTKGDRSEAVYKIARYAKAHRKLGYYWGGEAAARYDRLCAR
ncbi:hypothetical protein ABT340_15665 [Streptosporangium sp. NPDC000239]|uniref:hypothetical protein n=1 Tax=Streptosporangium sp. NPDC000239 TaxID=3154248 RepID=UPI00331B41FC